MYTTYLEFRGFSVLSFATPDAAFDAALRTAPELVITRIRQEPDQMDGVAVTTRIRHDTGMRHAGIIVITTSMLPRDHERAMLAGCDAFFLLPVPVEAIAREAEAILRRRHGTTRES